MKRNVEPDYKFDMTKFADVFKAAIGDRSYSQFAKESGISFGYISKYVNMKHDVSPTIRTLKKIATVSKGPSYLELLEAAGYESSKYEEKNMLVERAKASFDWSSVNVLLSTFCRTTFKWQFINGTIGGPIAVKIEGTPFDMWYFIPVIKKNVIKEDISAVLGNEKAEAIKSESKVTFLTTSKEVFCEISTMELNLISLRISVALIDLSNGCVCDEQYVKTAVEMEDGDIEFVLTNIESVIEGPLSL